MDIPGMGSSVMGRARGRGRGRGRGRRRTMRGGSDCTACSQPAAVGGQTGGKMSALNPESLGGGTFDRSGGALANQAYSQYLGGSQKLSALASSGGNAMMGGRSKRRRGKGRSAKKYSRKSRSKSRSRSNSKY